MNTLKEIVRSTKVHFWIVTAIAVVFLLISGCASTQTEEQIFDNDQDRLLTLERYNTCRAYKESWNQIWYDNTGTSTGRRNQGPPPVWAMKIQMGVNNCGRLLRSLDMD